MFAPLRFHAPDHGRLPPQGGKADPHAPADKLFATPILVVEDESMIAWMIEDILTTAGFTAVTLASTGEQAETIAAGAIPGLIVSDINLGAGKDGIAAAAAIRGTTRLPILFVTAYADDKVRERIASTLPGAQLLRKPVDSAGLLRAIMRALGN